MNKWHGGKGSRKRPYDPEVFDREFDRIFGKKAKTKICCKCYTEYRLDFYRTRQVNYKVFYRDICKSCED